MIIMFSVSSNLIKVKSEDYVVFKHFLINLLHFIFICFSKHCVLFSLFSVMMFNYNYYSSLLNAQWGRRCHIAGFPHNRALK